MLVAEKPNATYEEVCSGETGHAECVSITFDEKIIYEKILDLFLKCMIQLKKICNTQI